MDKFGIFNLINSFLEGYKSKSPTPSSSPNEVSVVKTSKKEDGAVSSAPHPPLKEEMLKAIKEHDSFVKRVLKDNK